MLAQKLWGLGRELGSGGCMVDRGALWQEDSLLPHPGRALQSRAASAGCPGCPTAPREIRSISRRFSVVLNTSGVKDYEWRVQG